MFTSKTIKLLLGLVTGLLLAQGASAQSCEPSKVAQKYPSLAGKTIRIGVDPESPPYAFRDSKDFNKIIGADADMARAVFDCAGVKTEFFTAGWPCARLMPRHVSRNADEEVSSSRPAAACCSRIAARRRCNVTTFNVVAWSMG